MANETIARCYNCSRAWRWKAGPTRRLRAMRCPTCQNFLDQTTHLLQKRFRLVPTEVADLIASGVYDDWGKVR